jgi:hypothetical protein
MEEIGFESLIGKHYLSGVDQTNERIKEEWGDGYEDCEAITFVLDGKTYVAVEDPSDGYRSSMRCLQESESTVNNTFEPIEVLVKEAANRDKYEVDHILEMIDTTTGLVVLEIGTANTDDYYPYWVGNFYPQNMACNKNQ